MAKKVKIIVGYIEPREAITLHIAGEKGSMKTYDQNIFHMGQIMQVAEKMKKKFEKDGEECEVVDRAKFNLPTCEECGSENVEYNAWFSWKTGSLIESGDYDRHDTYCNDCDEHGLGIDF